MTWKAAVAVVQRPDGRLLAVTRRRNRKNINFPGGLRERKDRNPAATARRELLEETGIVAEDLKEIGRWKDVIAFQVLRWHGTLRGSPEGKPLWVLPSELTKPSCTFFRHNAALLRKVGPVVLYKRL